MTDEKKTESLPPIRVPESVLTDLARTAARLDKKLSVMLREWIMERQYGVAVTLPEPERDE